MSNVWPKSLNRKMSKSMPIVKQFNIDLEKSQRVYRAGETVWGKCQLNVEGTLQLRHLDINLICEGSVDCKQTKQDKETMSTLISKYDLMKRSATDQTLQGFIEIDFSFTIPEKGHPSSFAGKFGFIRYKVEAVVHKDWDIFRKEVVVTVVTPYNGSEECSHLPIVRNTHKRCGIFNDSIELLAKVDKQWFTPGDKVSVYCNVDNPTDHKLRLSLSLYMKQNYCSTKLKSKISNEETYDLIEPNTRCYSKRILLSIPSNLKTMSFETRIIKISYQIRALIEIIDTKESFKVDLPIVLTIEPKIDDYSIPDRPCLPPSYSDCQIFHRSASEDLCIPFMCNRSIELKEGLDEKSDKFQTKDLEFKEPETPESPRTPTIVDLPPSYAEVVFGLDYFG